MSSDFNLLQESFARVKPHGTKFASSFYDNLFNDYPQLKPLFANTNMAEQEDKLMQTLVLAVYNARDLAYLATILKDLGARHVTYGATQEHYQMVGAALLKTFEDYLGKDWTPEVKQVWTDSYAEIANLMLEGTKSPEEISKLENVSKPSTNPTTMDVASTPPLASASSLNYSEEISKLENVSEPSPNPTTMDVASKPPLAPKYSLNLKLLPIIFIVAGLLGVGLLYYHFNLTKEKQEMMTPKR